MQNEIFATFQLTLKSCKFIALDDSRTRARMLAKRVLYPPGFGGLIASSVKKLDRKTHNKQFAASAAV